MQVPSRTGGRVFSVKNKKQEKQKHVRVFSAPFFLQHRRLTLVSLLHAPPWPKMRSPLLLPPLSESYFHDLFLHISKENRKSVA